MRFLADDDRQLGRAEKSSRSNVPSGARENRLPRGGKAGRVCHLPAGDKAGPGTGWKTEELGEPLQHRFLDDRRCRGEHEQTRVLIPSTGEPISADGGRNASADYEAEEARPTGGDNSRVGASRQLLDNLS